MRQVLSILFITIYLCSTTQVAELSKLPVLLEHFREHRQWDSSISFFGFLYMHYAKDDNKYGDQARDMQMPFKTLAHSLMISTGFTLPSPEFTLPPKTFLKEKKQKLSFDSSSYSYNYLSSIWQPPRSC